METTSSIEETIRLGVEADVPPFESRDPAGELIGLNIELLRAMCIVMRARCEWRDQAYADMIPALNADRIDVIVPMSPTPARRQQIDFTKDLYELNSQLVARKGAPMSLPGASLQGMRIGVLRGTNREAFALAKWQPAGAIIVSYALNRELIAALLAGELDATLQERTEISYALLNRPEGRDFTLVGSVIDDPALGSGVALGIRQRDGALRDRLNDALTQIRANGTYQQIVDRYLK
ncbi:transporter substrate-binding domain-containing protein [Burkholderia pyrrocinia]